MKYLNKYYDIMLQYRQGHFGSENLTLHDILVRAGNQDLFNNMNLSEIQCLSEGASGLTKKMFSILQQDVLQNVLAMENLEKELKEYNIESYRIGTDNSDKELASKLKLDVVYCESDELPKDTEAMLCPAKSDSYFGAIKIQKDSATTEFSFRHELIHYFRDVKVGNKVVTEFARKKKGKTPSTEEQEVNYLTAASIMPMENIRTELDRFEQISSQDQEVLFLSELAKKYGQAENTVFRRLIEVRRLADHTKNAIAS